MTVCESFLKFDLPDGSRHHEDVNPNDSTGIDLEVSMRQEAFWIEVKNWDSPTIPPAQLAEVRKDFVKKMASDDFWASLARKAKGTHDCLEPRGDRPSNPRFVFLYACSAPLPFAITSSVLEREVANHSELADVQSSVVSRAVFAAMFALLNTRDCALDHGSGECLTKQTHKCSRQRQLHRP